MLDNKTFDRAEAWVTPEGIFFQGVYYSCRKALKHQWFQRAQETGPWRIEMMTGSSDDCLKSIFTADSEMTEDDLCLPIEEPAGGPDTARDQYQAKIREMRGRLQELTGFSIKK